MFQRITDDFLFGCKPASFEGRLLLSLNVHMVFPHHFQMPFALVKQMSHQFD